MIKRGRQKRGCRQSRQSRLISSRLVLSPVRLSPTTAGAQRDWQTKATSSRKACEVAETCLTSTWPRPTENRGFEACCPVLLLRTANAVPGVLRSCWGTVVRTEECLSSLQGQPCLARTDSMPPGRMPNHKQHSISHSPPQSHPSWGRTPDQQRLRTSCRRPGIKPSECECECAGVVGWCCGSSRKGTLGGCVAPFWTVLHPGHTMLSGPAAL